MIENRELTMDDYLAMLRRRLKVILIPTLLAPLIGFGVSFFFAPRYTAQTTILVDPQKVSDSYVQPVVTQDLGQRVATLEARATSADHLRTLIEKLNQQGMLKGNVGDQIEAIRAGIGVVPVPPIPVSPGSGGGKKKSDLPGFLLTYTASSPREAQAICQGLADIIIDENFKDLEAAAQTNTDFLGRQLDEAKRDLDDQAARLAEFEKKYMGQLPGDADNNLKILMGLNSQLDANTQTLNRAQQDKTYADSMLAQQLAAWKSSQNATNPATLQQQLTVLQAQLLSLQSRYTDDYPDVVKAKRDIAEMQKRLDELNKAAANPSPDDKATDKESLSEPAEIRQLRMQIHQYQQVITQATRDQQRLQESIKQYESRVAFSPSVQQQYEQLTRDSTTAKAFYDNLLAKKSQSEMQTAMAREQQGEQMHVLNPANLPDSPSFPNRLLFAGGGLGAGLAIGLGLGLLLEFRDKSVRTESDVMAVLELPVLSQVPWVGVVVAQNNGAGKRSRTRSGDEKEMVEV